MGEFIETTEDHLTVCKPFTREDYRYQKVVELIRRHVPSAELKKLSDIDRELQKLEIDKEIQRRRSKKQQEETRSLNEYIKYLKSHSNDDSNNSAKEDAGESSGNTYNI